MTVKNYDKIAKNQTLYDLLQVHPNADTDIVEASAKALLKKHHPDRQGDEEIFKQIGSARDILINTKERAKYDEYIRSKLENEIGNYRITRKISEGGFARTFEGVHKYLGERVCIKHNINISKQDTELFIQEAKSIWDLRHHSLPAIRDMYMLDDGSCALVMSYIEGPTLEQITEEYKKKGEKIDPENICWIMERILDSLRYMHYHGVVHGDVKPQNIIVQPKEHTCVLVDFGLSIVGPDKDSSSKGYTEIFASPEAYGNSPLLPESDLYSLGMTMIYALGGNPAKKQVPDYTPKKIRNFISNLIVYDIANRPHWNKTDLVKELKKIRLEEFGRENSGYKKV